MRLRVAVEHVGSARLIPIATVIGRRDRRLDTDAASEAGAAAIASVEAEREGAPSPPRRCRAGGVHDLSASP